jgi:hypothetical protein
MHCSYSFKEIFMSTQPRLHLARIDPVQTSFDALFLGCTTTARSHLGRHQMSLTALWDFAQYLDLADAGYSKKTDSLYAMVNARCRAIVAAHGGGSMLRDLCGKSCALSDMVNEYHATRAEQGLVNFPNKAFAQAAA